MKKFWDFIGKLSVSMALFVFPYILGNFSKCEQGNTIHGIIIISLYILYSYWFGKTFVAITKE